MAIFCIQPGRTAWCVLREGTPVAACATRQEAQEIALLLSRRSQEQGEDATFAGISTEDPDPLGRLRASIPPSGPGPAAGADAVL
ncbi:MAG: hypothetical protein J0H15_08805 [Xanthomonadales bacterium]|nr:hypothetical protein [Xanthomonadales bacterium]